MSFTFSSNYPDYNLNFSPYISLSRERPLESYLLLILVIRWPWKVSKKHTDLPLGKKFYSRRKRDPIPLAKHHHEGLFKNLLNCF